MGKEKRFKRVVEYEEFIRGNSIEDKMLIVSLAIPIIGTLMVFIYWIFGRKVVYKEIK